MNKYISRSRHSYIIIYSGFPLVWRSHFHNDITLSSTESEYTGPPYILRELIPIMQLLKELKRAGFSIESTMPKVICKVFNENSGALEMAIFHNHRSRTKHRNVKLRHFRESVNRSEVTILTIGSLYQAYDYLTNVFNQNTLGRHHFTVQGW